MNENDMKLIKQFLEAGVHFGHQTNRWNPKMEKFIFGEKSGIYIIDLEKTKNALEEAREFMRDVARAGSYVLFVGTKKQAQAIMKEQALRCGMFYVNERWLGGTLTNFSTIRKSVKKLVDLENTKTNGTYEAVSKKERAKINKEIEKLNRTLEGIRNMDRLPGAVFLVDSKKEAIAVREANKLSIPVVALVDTNCDPDAIDYVIPGNDDAIKSISLITSLVTESVIEGKDQFLAGSAAGEEGKKKKLGEEEVDEKEVEELIEGDIRLKGAEEDKKKDELIPKSPRRKKRTTR